MSLAIQIEEIEAVLLADGWHEIGSGSFDCDSYEFVSGKRSNGDLDLVHGGGNSGICSTGFVFWDVDSNRNIFGPLTSLLAVRGRQT